MTTNRPKRRSTGGNQQSRTRQCKKSGRGEHIRNELSLRFVIGKLEEQWTRMYDIKATVTKATETNVKLTGDWPTDYLQAPGSIGSTEILRKFTPGEVFETFGGPTQRLEIYHAGNPLNLKVGDDVIVRCK
jgi:hypothetical protein